MFSPHRLKASLKFALQIALASWSSAKFSHLEATACPELLMAGPICLFFSLIGKKTQELVW